MNASVISTNLVCYLQNRHWHSASRFCDKSI